MYSVPKDWLDFFKNDFELKNGVTTSNKIDGKKTKIANFKLGGQDAVEFLYQGNYEGSIYAKLYSIKGVDNVIAYNINFTAADKESLEKHQPEIETILQSFRLFPQPSKQPAAFKRYENSELGFSFGYPSDWIQYDDKFDGKVNRANLRDTDNRDRVIFSLRKPGRCTSEYPDWRDKTDFNQKIQIGEHAVLLRDICENKNFYFESTNGQKISISLMFFGVVAEKKALQVLKSVKGLTPVNQSR